MTEMQAPAPATEEWRSLYQAAAELKAIAPWTWMYDSDVFGVQNPDTGEIGYSCVMGALGEMFALALYLGPDGLDGHRRIQAGEFYPPTAGALHIQRCLMASFEDREMLSKEDLQQIKALGLRFRGRGAWPQFRSYRPGFFPWYLTDDEVRFLTLALRQSAEVALRLRQHPELLHPPRPGLYLVRVPSAGPGGLSWRDEWLAPAPLAAPTPAPVQIDEVRVQRIKQAATARKGAWETDVFFAPTPVADGGRPYYPRLFLWVDRASGFILQIHLAEPGGYRAEFVETFLGLAAQAPALPREICVRTPEVRELLELVTARLEIKLTTVKSFKMLDDAREALFAHFSQL